MTIEILDFHRWLKHPKGTPAFWGHLESRGYRDEGSFGGKQEAMIHARALSSRGKDVKVVKNAHGHGEEWWAIYAK